MTTVLHDYRHIWRVAAIERSSLMVKILAWLAGLACAVGLVVGVFDILGLPFPIPATMLRVMAGAPAAALMAVWIMAYMPASVLMHCAPSARLLPRQRRRLLQIAFAGWLLSTSMMALATGNWALFLPTGLFALAFGLLQTGRPGALLLLLPGLALPDAVTKFATGADGLPLASALLVVCAWFLLRAQYPAGGSDVLERRGQAAQRMLARREQGAAKPVSVLSKGDVAYLFALRRDLRLRRPGSMLLHALGPSAHWTVRVPAAILVLSVGLAVRAWVDRHGGAINPVFAGIVLQPFTWAYLVASCTWPLRTRLGALRGEQALLRLTPLAGDAALLNRRLAGALLPSALMHCLLAASYIVVFWLLCTDVTEVLHQVALCCLAAQAALAIAVDDVLRRPRFNWMSNVWSFAPALLEGILIGILAWWGHFSPWPWLAAAGILGAIVQGCLGWRRLVAGPPVFPAGRFE